MNPITIQYSQSSLILKNIPPKLCDDFNLTFDPRTLEHKIPAIEYKDFLLKAQEKKIQITYKEYTKGVSSTQLRKKNKSQC